MTSFYSVFYPGPVNGKAIGLFCLVGTKIALRFKLTRFDYLGILDENSTLWQLLKKEIQSFQGTI